MIPGVNPRQVQQMMRQMGMSQKEIDAVEVIIKTPTEQYVFEKPQVSLVSMQGQETFQVIGTYSKQELDAQVSVSEEDVVTVSEQAGVSKERAKEALDLAKGDIAQAIVSLSEETN